VNGLDTGIAARLVSGLAATLALAWAATVAARSLVRWDGARASESQLALERKGHLASALVSVALLAQIGAFALTLLLADRLTGRIRGAMCAYGVLASGQGGFLMLGVSSAAAIGAVLWLAVDRVDARSEGLAILRTKLAWTVPLAALAALDLWTSTRFFLSLDFTQVSSCCSGSLDESRAATTLGMHGGARTGAAALAGALGLGAALASSALARRSTAARASLAAVLTLAAAAPAIVAVAGWVAPHVYETPAHLCPFCLLRAEHAGFGWALFASLFVAIAAGLAAAALDPIGRRPGAGEAARSLQAKSGRIAALAWLLFLVLCTAPVLRYLLATGGAPLFG